MSQVLEPLVEPVESLTSEEQRRYSRHTNIPNMGIEGQKRLKNARVLVIGAGGLGSPTLLYLAAAGVGTLGIVDDDIVDHSNLQRQVIHTCANIGRPKVDSAREAINALNPYVNIETHQLRLAKDNVEQLFSQYDLIIDGSDNFTTRYLINDAAVLANKPYVWGSVFRFEGQVSLFWNNPTSGSGINYRDLYPTPPSQPVASCSEGGVFGVLCASIGAIMSTEAIKLITGIGTPLLGRVLIYNALEMTHRIITIRQDPHAPRIHKLCETYDNVCTTTAQENTHLMNDYTISPEELQTLLNSNTPLTLIDVREPEEYALSHIHHAHSIPKATILSGEALPAIPADHQVVLYCKGGVRSAEALQAVLHAGFTNVVHLQGGIMNWANTIDPSLPIY